MPHSPSIREVVEFGLARIQEDRRVEVSLQYLVYVHQVLGELIRFFHQPLHYPDLKAVQAFLGSSGSGGGYEVLAEAYYDKLRDMLPPEIKEQLAEAVFEHPAPPAYYKRGGA
jgi:hypothetical protein